MVEDFGYLSPEFQRAISGAGVPVLVKDGTGFYVFANHAAEVFLGYERGQLIGKRLADIADLGDHDPLSLEAKWERFKLLAVWSGYMTFRRKDGSSVGAGINAFASRTPGAETTYTSVLHPFEYGQQVASSNSVPQTHLLTSDEIRLVQLLSADFSDRDLAGILGMSEPTVRSKIAEVLEKLEVRSRTEACIRCLKSGIISSLMVLFG